MQVFRTFYKIIKKNVGQIIMYIVIFAVLAIMFSYSGKENETAMFQTSKVKVTVIDHDHSMYSKGIIDFLKEQHEYVELEDKKEILQDAIFNRVTEYILMIPEGFEAHIKTGEMENLIRNVKIPNSYSGTYVDHQIDQYLTILRSYTVAGYSEAEVVKETKDTVNIGVEVALAKKTNETENPDWMFYFQYLPYILISIMIVAMGPILIVFYQKELNRRMLASAMSNRKKNLQLVTGCITFAIGLWVLLIGMAVVLYKDDITSYKGIWAIGNSFVFLVISMLLSYICTMYVKSQQTLAMIGNVVALGLCFLSGVFVPQEIMGDTAIAIGRFLPSYWYIRALNAIISYSGKEEQMREIGTAVGIQIMFVIAMFALAMVLSKMRRVEN